MLSNCVASKLIEVSKEQFPTIFYFSFDLGQSAFKRARRINHVWNQTVFEKGWLKKLRSEDFSLEDESRSERPTAISDDDLKAFVEANPSQTVREIAKDL